jgi:hypothetical protein
MSASLTIAARLGPVAVASKRVSATRRAGGRAPLRYVPARGVHRRLFPTTTESDSDVKLAMSPPTRDSFVPDPPSRHGVTTTTAKHLNPAVCKPLRLLRL